MALRQLRLAEHQLGFYEGREPGASAPVPDSWVEDGALSLGICSYALIDGDEAIVYDTHVSVERGLEIRHTLEALGARRIRVVLSHWHLDHVAGNEAFADCEIIANRRTSELLATHREAIEAGTYEGPPAIAPLVVLTALFDDRLELELPHGRVELVELEIHSRDATVLLPDDALLLAGDTVEDTVTYVSEPARLERHIEEHERLRALPFERILPSHGSLARIEGGGYDERLIDVTSRYISDLLLRAEEPGDARLDLRAFVAPGLATGAIEWFEPYQRVHLANLEAVVGRGSSALDLIELAGSVPVPPQKRGAS